MNSRDRLIPSVSAQSRGAPAPVIAGRRVGLIEIGSRSVRYMVAEMRPDWDFDVLPTGTRDYVHNIDVDDLDRSKLEKLWMVVEDFMNNLRVRKCDRTFIYGTELCRKLKGRPDLVLPSFVTVLDPRQEALVSWMAGFLGTLGKRPGMRCTVLDQGGGSVELASATWTGKTVADIEFESFDDLGSTRLAKVYASNGGGNAKAVQGLLDAAKERVEMYGRAHKSDELFGLGSAPTKLGFNIGQKRGREDAYDFRRAHGTNVNLKQIMAYYNRIAKLYNVDPLEARKEVDLRTVDTDDYERVMSGALVLLFTATRLGRDRVTVSSRSTRHGMGALLALDLIEIE